MSNLNLNKPTASASGRHNALNQCWVNSTTDSQRDTPGRNDAHVCHTPPGERTHCGRQVI